MKRNIGLDILKILACFCVVILHVVGDNINFINSSLYYMAGCAVPIFFLVNGYLLLSKNSITYKYILKKISNILFIVFLWNIILTLILRFNNLTTLNPIYGTIKNLIQKEYFWQFWFFGAIMIIYTVLPIISKYFKSVKKAILITMIFVIASISVDLLSILRSYLGHSIIQIHFIQTFRLWTWFSYFLLGGLIAKKEINEYIIKQISNLSNIIIVFISTSLIVFYQYMVGHFLYKNLYAEFFYDNIFTFLWVISLFLLVCRQDFSKLRRSKKIIELLSANTMGVYIVHVTVVQFIARYYNYSNSKINILMVFVVFFISITISIIISKIPILNKLVKI